MRALRNIAPAPVVLHQHGRLCTACFTNSGNIPSLQRFPCIFSSLCTSPRPKPQINISKHVSCLHPDSPSSHLPASLYTSPPSFASMMPPTPQSPPTHTPSIISHTCSPFPVHHLFSSRPRPNPNLPASPPACSPKCVIFFHISSFAAPLLSSIQSPVQYVLWINKK